MLDLTPETDPQEGFDVGSLNPLRQEPGMNDPNRVTLMDTFGQEGLGAGLKQLTQMVTPQSMWGQASAGSVMNDFVEFSPIGDVRDFLAAVNPNSGLDPLERGLGVFSALPMVGGGLATSYKLQQVLRQQYHQRQLAAANALTDFASTAGEPATLRYAQYYDVSRDLYEGDLADADPGAMTPAELAAFKQEFEMNRSLREGLEGGKKYLATSNVYELAEVYIGDAADPLRVERLGSMFNELGVALRQDIPDVFDQGARVSEETQNLEAAKFALMTYQDLADGGLLHESRGEGGDLTDVLMTVDGMKENLLGYKANEELHRIHSVVRALANVNIGPDLKATPQFQLGAVIIPDQTGTARGQRSLSNVGGVGARVVLFGNDLMPDQRIMDADGIIADASVLEERQRKVDYQALTGDMAANVMRFFRMGEQSMTPAEMQRGRDWYRRANTTARVISKHSGLHVRQVAALMSGLSPRSKWAPDNLVASIHAALRFGNQDMHPSSPEYKQAFREAVTAGGWEHDLYKDSSKPLKKEFAGNLDGLVDWYADVNNFTTESGDSLRGMSLGSHQEAAAMAAVAQMPPDLVLRMAKTNNFYAAILDPENPNFMAVDVWHDSLVQGFKSPVQPLGSSSQRQISINEIAEGTYQFPSGATFDLALVERGEAALREAGLNDAEIEYAMRNVRKIPTEGDDVRYQAIKDATRAAGAILGNDIGSSIQATVWNPARDAWFRTAQQLRALKREGLGAESQKVISIRRQLVVDRSVMDHYEGNPKYQKNVVALTQNVSNDLSVSIPLSLLEGRTTRAETRDSTGTPYIISQRPDGTAEVWADTTNGAAMRTLRHLQPAPQKIGDWTRMVPKEPKQVQAVQDTLRLLDEGPGQSRVLPSGVYVGNQPGNFFVFETTSFESAQELQTLLDSIEGGPYEMTIQQVGVTRSAPPAPVENFAAMDEAAVHNPATSPFVTNDWVAISAEVNPDGTNVDLYASPEIATENLRQDLLDAVQAQFGVDRATAERMVLPTEGYYGGNPEQSFMVFGLNYDTAMRLGEKYGQEAVATRNGMIYTTDEYQGEYHPVDDSATALGAQAEQGEGYSHTRMDRGYARFSQGYEWGERRLVGGDPNSLMGQHTGTEPRQQLIVSIDGAEGQADWWATERLWKAAQGKAVSSTAYTNGDLHRPKGTQPVHEHVYTDGVSTGVRRTRLSDNPGAVRAYVPIHEHAQVGDPIGIEGPARLTKSDASAQLAAALADMPAAPMGVTTGPSIQIGDVRIGGLTAELEVKNPRKGVLEWEFAYNGDPLEVNGFTVDLSGPQPVIQHTFGPQSVAPGLVRGIVENGKAVLTAADPNDHIAAAVALESLGYSVKGAHTVHFMPTQNIDMPTEGLTGLHIRAGRRLEAMLYPLPTDYNRTQELGAKYGAEFVWSTSTEISPEAQGRFFETLEALLDPDSELLPGVTLAPHVLSRAAIPGGIGMTRGMAAHLHGATDIGSAISDRIVTVNERLFLAEDKFGPEVTKRLDQLRDPNHFADSGHLTFSQHVLTHEVGHAVLTWLSHHLPPGGDVSRGALESRLQGLSAQLGGFGVSRNLGGYAFGDAHEFFAEAFTAVAAGTKVDPRVERMVLDVVDLVNQTLPGSDRLTEIPGPWT